ncbi:MAG: hypothetical protein M1540_01725 [Candidatus Bathyarchaeota archaeon]|nr:hypothetical protein [Candidatus Bathyarchaeota archaeon]
MACKISTTRTTYLHDETAGCECETMQTPQKTHTEPTTNPKPRLPNNPPQGNPNYAEISKMHRSTIPQSIGCMVVFLNDFPIFQQFANQVNTALADKLAGLPITCRSQAASKL